MAQSVSARPDETRARLLRSVFEVSPLQTVAEAVSVATEEERRIYVERVDGGWRWSLTHPGGAYPLLRITARFLRGDYQRITVGFRTVADGVCVLCADPDEPSRADSWAVIEFDAPTSATIAQERIVEVLGDV